MWVELNLDFIAEGLKQGRIDLSLCISLSIERKLQKAIAQYFVMENTNKIGSP